MPPELHVWNGERAHVGRWRELDGVAVIAPPPGEMPPSTSFIEHCCAMLDRQGFSCVVTPALTPGELVPFLQAGFQAREQLYVLIHQLGAGLPGTHPAGIEMQRARTGDIPEALALDARAFDAFWRFDRHALLEACSATPQSRFRVARASEPIAPRHPQPHLPGGLLPKGTLMGYCITGRSRTQGFLQRLAVVPEAWGLGMGHALVYDGLAWLARRRARSCIVNTQQSNERAASLYVSCGFDMSPSGLFVLTRPLASGATA